MNLNELQPALVCFERSLQLNSNSHYSLEAKGVTLNLLGAKKEGIRCFIRAVKLVDILIMFQFRSKWFERGNLLLKKGDYCKAIESYDVGIFYSPNSAMSFLNEDYVRFRSLGKNDQFFSDIQKTIENKKIADIWTERAIKSHDLNNLGEAVKYYDEALKLYPHHIAALDGKGRACFDDLNYIEAKRCFDTLTVLNPYEPIFWYWKGVVALAMGEAGSGQYFDRSLKLNPSSVMANLGKGAVLFGAAKHKEAIEYYKAAIDRDRYNYTAWLYKAKSHMVLKEYEDAAKSYDEVINIDNTDYEAWFGKGEALEKLGNRKDADICFDKAKQLATERES